MTELERQFRGLPSLKLWQLQTQFDSHYDTRSPEHRARSCHWASLHVNPKLKKRKLLGEREIVQWAGHLLALHIANLIWSLAWSPKSFQEWYLSTTWCGPQSKNKNELLGSSWESFRLCPQIQKLYGMVPYSSALFSMVVPFFCASSILLVGPLVSCHAPPHPTSPLMWFSPGAPMEYHHDKWKMLHCSLRCRKIISVSITIEQLLHQKL